MLFYLTVIDMDLSVWTLPRLDAYFIGLLSMVIIIIVSITGLLITLVYSLLSRLLVKA